MFKHVHFHQVRTDTPITYNVSCRKNSVNNSTTKGSHHAEADEDNRRHQLWKKKDKTTFLTHLKQTGSWFGSLCHRVPSLPAKIQRFMYTVALKASLLTQPFCLTNSETRTGCTIRNKTLFLGFLGGLQCHKILSKVS